MIAMLSEIRALNQALAVHAKLLERHEKCVAAGATCAVCGGPMQPNGIIQQLGRAFGGLIDEEDPPPRRRRR